jgi:hypothetical protein
MPALPVRSDDFRTGDVDYAGPNNAMLSASGLNFGFRRTLPHMVGITFGCMVMMVAIGLGLAQLFEHVPALASRYENLDDHTS